MSVSPDKYCWPHSTAYYSTIGCPGCACEMLFYQAAAKRRKDWMTPNKRLEEKLAIAVEALEKLKMIGINTECDKCGLGMTVVDDCVIAVEALAKIRGKADEEKI